MGAGRKTETYYNREKPAAFSTVNCSGTARNLGKSNLGGAIFGCKHSTVAECFSKRLFGLPSPHYSYVRNITPGLTLFLFNYSDRTLHGIFEASSPGRLGIDPNAWTADGSNSTPYSAQVMFSIRMRCNPLREDQFAPVIAENYYEPKLFWFELDRDQTSKLVSLFSASPIVPRALIPRHAYSRNNLLEASHRSNAKQVDDNTESEALLSFERPGLSSNRQGLPLKPWNELFKSATTSDGIDMIPEANNGKELQYHSKETITVDIKSRSTPLKTESGSVAREVVGEVDHGEDAKCCLKETMTTDLKPWGAQVKAEGSSNAREVTEGIIASVFPQEPSGLLGTEASSFTREMTAETIHVLNLDMHSDESMGSSLLHEASSARCGQTISDKTFGDSHRDDLPQHLTQAGISKVESEDLHSMVAKLSVEVKALKLSRLIQDGKISYLEHKLVESSLEVQQLRDWCKKLDSRSVSKVKHLEA